MSELHDFLTSAQLTKHYELLRFLSQNPNKPYTLAELDYLLPHGASIQRFPSEWIAFVRSGRASGNIDVSRQRLNGNRPSSHGVPGVDVGSSAEEEDDDDSDAAEGGEGGAGGEGDWDSLGPVAGKARRRRGRASVVRKRGPLVLMCRRPVVESTEELLKVLYTPRTRPDPASCIGVHTEQLIISPQVIAEGVRAGLVYFFSDKVRQGGMLDAAMDRRQLALRSREPTGTDELDSVQSALRADSESVAGVTGRGEVANSVPLRLPADVTLQYNHVTLRGVSVRGSSSLPQRLRVGERVLIRLDCSPGDAAALGTRPPLEMSCSFGSHTGVRIARADGGTASADTPAISFSVRLATRQRIVAELHAHRAASVVAALRICGKEHLFQMEVAADGIEMPGVIVAADGLVVTPHRPATAGGPLPRSPRRPSRLVAEVTLPEEYVLCDDDVQCGTGTAPGWWNNPAVATLSVARDACLPDAALLNGLAQQHCLHVITSSNAAQSAVQDVLLRRRREAAKFHSKRRRRRRAVSSGSAGPFFLELRNTHMIHFGLDALTPFARTS